MPEEEHQRRLVAILSADVAGYSRLMAHDEQATVRTITAYRKEIGKLVADHRGRLVDATGDNALAEFPTALDAVEAALDVQRVLRARNASLPDGRRMEFRIGIHIGDVTVEEGCLYGDGVNVAARIEALAEPGGICLSASVHDQVDSKLGLRSDDMGEQRLKNIPKRVHVFRLRDEEPVPGDSGPAGDSQRPSIVVLPFSDMSPGRDQEYFCDGIADEIIGDLSAIGSLRVISFTSSLQLRGSTKSIRAIGEELGVRYVLEGSVRRAADDLRISARLIDVASDAQLWGDRFGGTLQDVFDVQQNVSRSIADALKISLSPQENQKLAERSFDSLEAYESYHRARREMFKMTAEGLNQAVRDLQVGLDLVGDNLLLLEGLAEAYLQHYEYGVSLDDETLAKVDEFRGRIEARQPDSAVGHYLSGRLERFRGSVLEAADDFERALENDPGHTNAQLFLGMLYAHQIGRTDLARPLLESATEVDPLTPLSLLILSALQWMEGLSDPDALEDGLATLDRASKTQPDATFPNLFRAYILAWLGRKQDLAELVQDLEQRGVDDAVADWCRFFEAGVNGRSSMDNVLSEETRTFFWKDPDVAWLVAASYALNGQVDESLRWLEHTVRRGWINYPLWKSDPLLANLRQEARFGKLMRRVKEAWETYRP